MGSDDERLRLVVLSVSDSDALVAVTIPGTDPPLVILGTAEQFLTVWGHRNPQ